jgi:8-oxo-dGTP diphosphatase
VIGMIERTHLLARGVIFRGPTEILVAKARGHAHTFLPGGHLESGESLANALAREVAEELGVPCVVDAYLGAIEFQWPASTPTDYEVNHIFRAAIDPSLPLVSREPHLTFTWCPVAELDAVQLEPKPLRALIQGYAQGDKSVWWASSISGGRPS